MGRDIHMHILDAKGFVIEKNIYDGRNSEWFDMITDGEDNFPCDQGFPFNELPEFILRDKEGCYDFRYLSVKDFIEWYETTKPYLRAGWISMYDQWLLQRKGIYPFELSVSINLKEDMDPNDYHFVEWSVDYDSSTKVFNYIIEKKVPKDAYIVYYFDC